MQGVGGMKTCFSCLHLIHEHYQALKRQCCFISIQGTKPTVTSMDQLARNHKDIFALDTQILKNCNHQHYQALKWQCYAMAIQGIKPTITSMDQLSRNHKDIFAVDTQIWKSIDRSIVEKGSWPKDNRHPVFRSAENSEIRQHLQDFFFSITVFTLEVYWLLLE